MNDGMVEPVVERRIAVVGSSGSGKATLARRLAERFGLTHVELDAFLTGVTSEVIDEPRRGEAG